ncbi:hypothetical protein ACIPSE_23695 [Streptomyces sp. NPDC090106]|uniref:hypothetical protein n=1 Tax=Streptomyces sp. NPDC090106 TaxID=3365946 RepID=UPI003828DB5C
MTTLLEARYRTVLRLLPAYYRRAREEEMVEVYLWDVDQETQDQSRPTLGEVASIAALAVRSRLAAAGAPRRYAVLGSAARRFALYAVLLQAAAVVSDEILRLTWAATHGAREREVFLSGFIGRGALNGVVEIAGWVLPLLWTVGFFALVHDRRRLARTAVLLAALPTLWPLLAPLVIDWTASDPWFALANALFAGLPALAVCAAYHRDAPPAALPFGTPGAVFAACCVLSGAAVVVLPGTADLVWAPAACFVLGALVLLAPRARRADGDALALAALGLLLLVVRVAALYPWLGAGLPADLVAGAVVQAAALALLVPVLGLLARRDLAPSDEAAPSPLSRGR